MEKVTHLETPHGAMMPVNKIKKIDLDRHQFVMEAISERKAMQDLLRQHKVDNLDKAYAFLDMVAQEYGTNYQSKKGNVTLSSYDQKFKIQIAVNEHIGFTEQLAIAEQLVTECIEDWSNGANENLIAFIKTAFHRTKEGGVSVSKMLGLLRLDINDEKWKTAMRALKDSMIAQGSKTYLRAYERESADHAWQAIPLDIAKI